MKKIANIAAACVILFTFILMIYFAFLMFYPPKIITPRVQPYFITPEVVHPGDIVYYDADVCKYTDTPGIVNRSIVGIVQYPLPDSTSHIEQGCSNNRFGVFIPLKVLPGVYYLQLDILYKVNFLRQDVYHFKTQKFTVIP